MYKQELIKKWEEEMDKIKIHIKEHEDNFGYPASLSRERYEVISEIVKDIKNLSENNQMCHNCINEAFNETMGCCNYFQDFSCKNFKHKSLFNSLY